jgi:DNA-directed RNA polymerase subunit K/omega
MSVSGIDVDPTDFGDEYDDEQIGGTEAEDGDEDNEGDETREDSDADEEDDVNENSQDDNDDDNDDDDDDNDDNDDDNDDDNSDDDNSDVESETNENNDLLEYQSESDYEDTEVESSDEEEDGNKVDQAFKYQFMQQIHPEEFHDNYDQMKVLCQITRNDLNLVTDENHKTIPILTRYEKARVLGLRISQLNKGAKPYIKVEKNHIIDMHIIAEQELKEKRLPFIIMRPIPNGNKEYWRLQDLEIIEN